MNALFWELTLPTVALFALFGWIGWRIGGLVNRYLDRRAIGREMAELKEEARRFQLETLATSEDKRFRKGVH